MALAYSKHSCSAFRYVYKQNPPFIHPCYTYTHIHSPPWECIRWKDARCIICALCRQCCSMCTIHCARIFFDHVELMSELCRSSNRYFFTTSRSNGWITRHTYTAPLFAFSSIQCFYHHWKMMNIFSVFSFCFANTFCIFITRVCCELLTQFSVCFFDTSPLLCTGEMRWNEPNASSENCIHMMLDENATRFWMCECFSGELSLRRIMLNCQCNMQYDNNELWKWVPHTFARHSSNQFYFKIESYFYPIPVVHLTVTKPIELNIPSVSMLTMNKSFFFFFCFLEMWCFQSLLLALKRDNLKCAHKHYSTSHIILQHQHT